MKTTTMGNVKKDIKYIVRLLSHRSRTMLPRVIQAYLDTRSPLSSLEVLINSGQKKYAFCIFRYLPIFEKPVIVNSEGSAFTL